LDRFGVDTSEANARGENRRHQTTSQAQIDPIITFLRGASTRSRRPAGPVGEGSGVLLEDVPQPDAKRLNLLAEPV
jgi:hypothetical protein